MHIEWYIDGTVFMNQNMALQLRAFFFQSNTCVSLSIDSNTSGENAWMLHSGENTWMLHTNVNLYTQPTDGPNIVKNIYLKVNR